MRRNRNVVLSNSIGEPITFLPACRLIEPVGEGNPESLKARSAGLGCLYYSAPTFVWLSSPDTNWAGGRHGASSQTPREAD